MTSFSLENLVGIGKLKKEQMDKAEFEGLIRSGWARVSDAKNEGLALESRFDLDVDGERHANLAKRQAIVRVEVKLCAGGVTPEELAESSGRSFNSIWRTAEGSLDSDELYVQLEAQANAGGPALDPGKWISNHPEAGVKLSRSS